VGARAVGYACAPDEAWRPTPASVERALDAAEAAGAPARAMVLNNPSNPSGAVLSDALTEDLLRLCLERNVFVVSDEIYAALAPPGAAPPRSALDFDEGVVGTDAENVVCVSGCSKAWSMCGFRVGFFRAHPHIVETANKVIETYVSCTSPVSQRAAIAALDGPQTCVADAAAVYEGRRRAALAVLERRGRLDYRPEGAFYLLVWAGDPDGGASASALDALAEKGVAVAPGDTFGEQTRGFVRISLCAAERDVVDGLERLCDLLDERGVAPRT
jgi:aspartate/methionine/tyrosine aminotransferase